MWHDGIPAKTRRVLMTKWAGKAWRELSSDEDFVKNLFEKTGCLMTADGEDDEKIRPHILFQIVLDYFQIGSILIP